MVDLSRNLICFVLIPGLLRTSWCADQQSQRVLSPQKIAGTEALAARASVGFRGSPSAVVVCNLAAALPMSGAPTIARRNPNLPGHYATWLYAFDRDTPRIVPYRIEKGDQLTKKRKEAILAGLTGRYVDADFRRFHHVIQDAFRYELKISPTPPDASFEQSAMRYVTDLRGQLVGYLTVFPKERRISHIFIYWNYRQRWIGRELFCAALHDVLRSADPGNITLVKVYLPMRFLLARLGMPHVTIETAGTEHFPLFRGEQLNTWANAVLVWEEAAGIMARHLEELYEKVHSRGYQSPPTGSNGKSLRNVSSDLIGTLRPLQPHMGNRISNLRRSKAAA